MSPFGATPPPGISKLTSSDGSITLTPPSGKGRTVDLKAASSGGGAMSLISEIGPLAAPQAAFDFTNIPQTFSHLRLVVHGAATGAAAIYNFDHQFNGDVGNDYNSYGFYSLNGGAFTTIQQVNLSAFVSAIGDCPGHTTPQGWGFQFVDILNYTAALAKRDIWLVGGSYGGTDIAWDNAIGLWQPSVAAAITRWRVFTNGGNFAAGSMCSLYGIS